MLDVVLENYRIEMFKSDSGDIKNISELWSHWEARVLYGVLYQLLLDCYKKTWQEFNSVASRIPGIYCT